MSNKVEKEKMSKSIFTGLLLPLSLGTVLAGSSIFLISQSNKNVSLEDKTKTVLQRKLSQLDVVTREEFDVQTQVLIKTRTKLAALEARLDELEAAMSSNE